MLELGAVRLGVLICQDLEQALDVGPIIRDVGISHLLVPVFSRPLQRRRWEHAAGGIHARESGTAVVVSNSLVMADILGTADPGTALLISPGSAHALVGHASGPAQPVGFRLHLDGAAELR